LDANGQCKSQSAVTKDVKKYKSNGIINIRTYAQQCNQLDLILNAIKSAGGGMTVLTAVWIDGKISLEKFSLLHQDTIVTYRLSRRQQQQLFDRSQNIDAYPQFK